MALPVLGLLVGSAPGVGVTQLLRTLGRWCLPRWAVPDETGIAAWLATSPDAPGLDTVLKRGQTTAVWIPKEGAAGIAARLRERGAILVTGDHATAQTLGNDVFFVPPGIDVSGLPSMTPFVRARWRKWFGLPEILVVSAGRPGAPPQDLLPTALALASAVAAAGPIIREALAWGAPCATDKPTAAMLGARDGIEVAVGDSADLEDLARTVSRDPRLAASLGRAGRRLVESRHDRVRPVAQLAKRLGLMSESTGPLRSPAEMLAAWWTSPDSRVVARLKETCFPIADYEISRQR